MSTIELNRYTVVNTEGEFLADDNLLLLPTWTRDIHVMWATASEFEAQKVAHQSGGQACAIKLAPLELNPAATKHSGIPVSVQKQIVTLRDQGLSYRKIAALLNISKSTVGNILNR
ncbi:helix-turn-helix domain-containing protein [Lacticaseibacillus hulanensis]|uniref:helix-turn-helix domain-containing protein n=1 Tax=Lacticaseibacillus hulanensis TaxID=2493111 RepID=UPI000FDB2AEA|nr:helix-turn-helix domain-containing protein [Lacticaseibacillus hulanensis]